MKYTTLIFSKVLSPTQCLLTNHVSYLEVKEDRCNLMKPLSRIKMYRVEWLGGGGYLCNITQILCLFKMKQKFCISFFPKSGFELVSIFAWETADILFVDF